MRKAGGLGLPRVAHGRGNSVAKEGLAEAGIELPPTRQLKLTKAKDGSVLGRDRWSSEDQRKALMDVAARTRVIDQGLAGSIAARARIDLHGVFAGRSVAH